MTELQAREREFVAREDFDGFWTAPLQRWGFTAPQITVILESVGELQAHPTPWVVPRPKISSGLDGWTYAGS